MKENQIVGIILFIVAVSDFFLYHFFIATRIKNQKNLKIIKFAVYSGIVIIVILGLLFYSGSISR
jgi:hypothetical protein